MAHLWSWSRVVTLLVAAVSFFGVGLLALFDPAFDARCFIGGALISIAVGCLAEAWLAFRSQEAA